jgi:hypothetical protein
MFVKVCKKILKIKLAHQTVPCQSFQGVVLKSLEEKDKVDTCDNLPHFPCWRLVLKRILYLEMRNSSVNEGLFISVLQIVRGNVNKS